MNKNSNDMKEQLTIISDDLNHGIITEKEARTKLLILFGVSGSATVDINTQVEILKKVINKLMITFDDENDRMDYILDICNEYRKEAEKHYR
jgi:hypothetical protein